MSQMEEIPAFSIWQTFSETLPTLVSIKPSEKSVEHLAKIIKSGDFSNIFVYTRDPTMSFESYKVIADKYTAFTTWFLGHFFYLLSCEKLSKNHTIYVDIQLCILDDLSKNQLHVYKEMALEYSNALHELTLFTKSEQDSVVLNVFTSDKFRNLNNILNLSPVCVEICRKNLDEFVVKVLKFVAYTLSQNFDFQCWDSVTGRNLDNLLHLLSTGPLLVKLAILDLYLQLANKLENGGGDDHNFNILHKMELFFSYLEQVTYEVYNERCTLGPQLKQFEDLLVKFLDTSDYNNCLAAINDFLLEKSVNNHGLVPSADLQRVCRRCRRKPLYDFVHFPQSVVTALAHYDTSFFCGLKSDIVKEINTLKFEGESVKLYNPTNQGKWPIFHQQLLSNFDNINCPSSCNIDALFHFLNEAMKMLTEIRVQLGSNLAIPFKCRFFEDTNFFLKILSVLNRHLSSCVCTDVSLIFEFFLQFSFVCRSKTLLCSLFDVFSFTFTRSSLGHSHVTECADLGQFRKELGEFLRSFSKVANCSDTIFPYLNQFIGPICIDGVCQLQDMGMSYLKICKQFMAGQDVNLQLEIIRNLPVMLSVFYTCGDQIISQIVTPVFSSSDELILREITKVLPQIICMSSSKFCKLLRVDEDGRVQIHIQCTKCSKTDPALGTFPRIELDASALTGMVLKHVIRFLTFDNSEMRLTALTVLPVCSSHILKFHTGNIARVWVTRCEDRDEAVRKKFAYVVARVLHYGAENEILSASIKTEILDMVFEALMKLTKKSLQHSDYKLQETVLWTVQEISNIRLPTTVLPLVKILIYLIMVPTSKHSLIAVNKFFNLAERHDTTTSDIYRQNKQEICETIVHLCLVNQTLVKYKLATSLCKISVTLGFYGSKDFVLRECQYLLPSLVSRIIRDESVQALIEEVALMLNVTVSELVASVYGHIFVYVFFRESKQDFQCCMRYLEKTTGLSGVVLRKRNLCLILNEILLNFHEKNGKVLLALKILAKEECGRDGLELQKYLQTRFLGLLQHFDFKLMARSTNRKNMVLLSLADLFKYMGPSYIGPLRFKIIAMLRTADCEGFPELNCEVWNAFVRSCDVESLGPQLATIFVSLLPLIRTCPRQINDIFRYLVVRNEAKIGEFIKDLFFVDEPNIDGAVMLAIKKYVKEFNDLCFREKTKVFLKYLSHETVEVRVRSLRHLKQLMEQNREELDQMILGYNGIDPIIVELIDILVAGCREKDPELTLLCGQVVGELGAVEPAHLPRRYAQNSKGFTFFISDDAFIVAALNELTRAFQGEKNTVNMDRFAVAIQETLKIHDISPEKDSRGNHLWKEFSESVQELMLPLLKSRYIIAQPPEANLPTPIYGSAMGASFQSWLYTWTCSLVATLSTESQSALTPCLPAMKKDHKILMHYLPHVLLHSIVNGSEDAKEKCFIEINTVTCSFINKKKLDLDQLDIRPFPVPNVPPSIDTVTPEEVRQTQCTKVVFVLLDFLNRWVREWQWQKKLAGRKDDNFATVKTFLERFCKRQLAKCNYHCGEYPRALMYLEDYVTENPHNITSQFSFLAEIYGQLDEPDGVAGVIALQQTEPSIDLRILALEVAGKLSDAAACYERISQPLQLHHLRGLVQCYLDLDNVHTALNFAQGALDRQPQFGNTLLELQAEPLWRLGRYTDLDALLRRPEIQQDNSSWGVQVGRALLAFQRLDRGLFEETLERLRGQQVELLGAASLEEGSYQHGYGYISRLHALNELQQVERATQDLLLRSNDDRAVEGIIRHLAREWELRIKVVQESVRIVEPLLCLRRVAVEQAKRIVLHRVPRAVPLLRALLGDCWLLSAKTARAAGAHQQAYTYALKAEEFAPPNLFLEKAQLHWMREEHEQALTTLKRGLEVMLPNPSSQEAVRALSLEQRKLCAEAKLLIATYNDAISNVDTDVKKTNYKESIDMFKEWERNWVCSAQFLDRLLQQLGEEDRDTKGGDLQIRIINNFCKSLEYGTTHVYQSMPRLLSIWFDFGTRLQEAPVSAREEHRKHLLLMSKLIDSFLGRLPAYVFLTAFSQIISRLCHSQKEVYLIIKSIVVKLLLHYPQQCLWTIISAIKSGYDVRAKRCKEILADPELQCASMVKLVGDFTALAERLIELCNKTLPADVEVTKVSSLLKSLPRMLLRSDFSEVMIPTHRFRKLVLPNPDFASGHHNPFPNHYVHIKGIEEELTVLKSLQRPRKITFKGSDGKRYIQMLKPKDDLRKDFRLMEFNDIVNQLLSREPEARQRRLHIRLYSVSPLNEECGLIEWVPNLVGLRPVLLSLYEQRGIFMMKVLRETSSIPKKEDPLSKKRDIFTKLLTKHPPVLGEWFRKSFPDAQSWVFARTAYIRTTAVISMVGYVLGLGDRHGENILLDSICGDTVHVDFNCLFNKGESFEWPERVPFRLTQNMVAAMGPLGVEGVFRKSCACTLRVLRTNTDTLMSIVTPFVYDPQVSWTNEKGGRKVAEKTNEQALEHIKNIELRLQGIVTPSLRTSSRSKSIPLSVDGQTAFLIKEAMDVDNLCQMYIGWGPYL